MAQAILDPGDGHGFDFTHPDREPALQTHDSVSWRVFKNPVSLYIGGITAVLLELAEPRVRTGVWDHSGFRADPVKRLRRTGLAAMITVYGARSKAETMIAAIRRSHDAVRGVTSGGETYYANDPGLLNWVHATASFGFLNAFCTYVRPLPKEQRDRYYAEGHNTAHPYGATLTPGSESEMDRLIREMQPEMEPSPIIGEFLNIMRDAPVLPKLLRPTQKLFVAAAIELLPMPTRNILGLDETRLGDAQKRFLRSAGRVADRVMLRSHPAVQACQRLGVPKDYLFRHR